MMLLLLVRFLLLVLILVAMCLTPPTLLTHLFWNLLCLLYLQLLMSSTRASPTMRSSYWRESSALCICYKRRGGDLLETASSTMIPLTSSLTAPSKRSLTHSTSTTTTIGTTPVTSVRAKKSTASVKKEEVPKDDVCSKFLVCRMLHFL
jgi:hypothetical protein